MQPFAFCNRCRGMKVGWNRRYVLHCLICREWICQDRSKLLVLTGTFVFICLCVSCDAPAHRSRARALPEQRLLKPALTARADIEQAASLKKCSRDYGVDRRSSGPGRAARLWPAARSTRWTHGLVASIVIVESGANPFAVSDADSVGIMQIHLGTWGELADKENINLFKIEDNVDFGVRILRDYIADTDLWEGVARYRGKTDAPESQQAAAEYVQKVQRIYGLTPKIPTLTETSLAPHSQSMQFLLSGGRGDYCRLA